MRLDLSKVINEAITLILRDIISGVKRGAQFRRRFEKNAPSTIAQKGHDKPLIGTRGTFADESEYIIKKASYAKQEGSIEVPQSQIAEYNQLGTRRGIPARPFFGISEKVWDMVDPRINKELNKVVDYELQKAGFRKL